METYNEILSNLTFARNNNTKNIILQQLLDYCPQICDNLDIDPMCKSETRRAIPQLRYYIKPNNDLNFILCSPKWNVTLVFMATDDGNFMLNAELYGRGWHEVEILLGNPCLETLQAVIALYKTKFNEKRKINSIAPTLRELIKLK